MEQEPEVSGDRGCLYETLCWFIQTQKSSEGCTTKEAQHSQAFFARSGSTKPAAKRTISKKYSVSVAASSLFYCVDYI